MEADSAVRWDWLLHSPVKFEIDEKKQELTTVNTEKGFKARTKLFSASGCSIAQTDKFVAPPDSLKLKRNIEIPDQWHMTAAYAPSKANRVLAVIEVRDEGETFSRVKAKNGVFGIGDWIIEAELDVSRPAGLRISNSRTDTEFILGEETSTLYDSRNGKWLQQKIRDAVPVVTAVQN